MPSLNWIGKDKVLNHHNEVPYRVLDKKYSYGDEDAENMIIHGDNLEALKSLLPKYEGKIKCIYIDPPYNTGNDITIMLMIRKLKSGSEQRLAQLVRISQGTINGYA